MYACPLFTCMYEVMVPAFAFRVNGKSFLFFLVNFVKRDAHNKEEIPKRKKQNSKSKLLISCERYLPCKVEHKNLKPRLKFSTNLQVTWGRLIRGCGGRSFYSEITFNKLSKALSTLQHVRELSTQRRTFKRWNWLHQCTWFRMRIIEEAAAA